jgi:hypothetical protein
MKMYKREMEIDGIMADPLKGCDKIEKKYLQ